MSRMARRTDPDAARLEYQSDNATVIYHSDKPTGSTAGSETLDVLEFLARVASHIPKLFVHRKLPTFE